MKKSYTLSDIAKIFVGNILKNEKKYLNLHCKP